MSNLPALNKTTIHQSVRGYAIIPMITPLTPTLEIDTASARRLADHIVGGGCQGLLLGGTNGEGPSMPIRQRLTHIETVASHLGSRGRVFAGVGSASYTDTIELGRQAMRAGAAAVVVHPAPYFVTNAAETEAYYVRVADAIGAPLFLYNIPITTHVSIPLEVVERLSHHPLIIGIKDSEGDPARQETIAATYKKRTDFTVFCGAAAHSARSMRAGSDGSVPSAGNLDPVACRRLVDLGVANSPELDAAQQRANDVALVYQQGRQLPGQIAALKACASILGLMPATVMPPLLNTPSVEVAAMREKLAALGLRRK